ncbi:MAG: hypothetical protein OXG92_08075 [Chloroflexi bacterium]|nr:hypothetical protein [Chloroflexota bacterium]MCY3581954.1 hypothetical protein [Chloroflexota bacterium]MCY3716406.1 hypothetical protein [Chloroflexota bacterium]MDE2650909.1 hypothetical protein [Chloroflexota bacterium]MXV93665.1 hypothetical protein [Chloroflexota bacterium]
MLNDRRIRQLVIAVLVVILALGLLSLVGAALQLIVPLTIIAIGGFAFYKIVLEGRDEPEAMADEVAEASGAGDPLADAVFHAGADQADAEDEMARERLSAIVQARSNYLDAATPAQEVLDHIRKRKQRLEKDDAP